MRHSILLSFVLFCLIALTACSGSKVSKENYDHLAMGQTYREVVQILGEPDQCEAVLVAKSCRWGQEPKTISVNFVSDQVILFSGSGL